MIQRFKGIYELNVDAGSAKKRRKDQSNFTFFSFGFKSQTMDNKKEIK
jgi:hypothetical protein